MRHQYERIKVPVIQGEREDLDKVTARVPFDVAAQLQGLAKSKRQSVSLYLSNLITKHVKGGDHG
jgi:hypothetical protein